MPILGANQSKKPMQKKVVTPQHSPAAHDHNDDVWPEIPIDRINASIADRRSSIPAEKTFKRLRAHHRRKVDQA
jgi:hypothetical protein